MNGFLFDEHYLLHDPGARHPEAPARLMAIRDALSKFGALQRWKSIEARPVRLETLELIHHPGHIEHIQHAARRAPVYLDSDTVVSAESYRVALLAAGGVLACVDALMTGNLRRAFAFVRPPGHHAEPDRAMGFCLFNNVALAAAYARAEYRLERVAVVDMDVHHGNGTQACFYDDPHVLYVSSHQFPFYPGTGDQSEIGLKEGRGYTVNFPLPEGTGDEVVVPLYSKLIATLLDQFQPELILVSAGFDAHYRDPLADLTVTGAGYASMAASLIRAANRHCAGKICFVLEGGYHLHALEQCARAVMTEMELENPHELTVTEDALFREIREQSKRGLGEFWKI